MMQYPCPEKRSLGVAIASQIVDFGTLVAFSEDRQNQARGCTIKNRRGILGNYWRRPAGGEDGGAGPGGMPCIPIRNPLRIGPKGGTQDRRSATGQRPFLHQRPRFGYP